MKTNSKFYGSHLVGESTDSFFVSNAYHVQGTSSPSHSHEYGCLHFVLDGVYAEKIENETFAVEPEEFCTNPAAWCTRTNFGTPTPKHVVSKLTTQATLKSDCQTALTS